MMMSIGLFVFSMQTAAYQEFQRSTNWRHPSNSRVGDSPAYQFTGKGEDVITLKGTVAHEISGNRTPLEVLRQMADTGKAYTLIEGTGKIYGLVAIADIDETRTYFFNDGAARKTDFTIKLTIVRDTKKTPLGTLIGMSAGLLNQVI